MTSVNFTFRQLAFAILLGLGICPSLASITVPLKLVNLGTAEKPEYKLGIYVGLGDGAPHLYEFDTGAAGFFAAYSAPTSGNHTPWWSKFSSTGQKITMSYASGIQYNTTIVNSTVQLYASDEPGAHPLASLKTQVGQISSAVGSKVTTWNQDLASGKAPLYGNFYGDFGMALYRNEGNTPVPPIPNPDTNPCLYPVIPQLGPRTGLLGNGFILRMGSYASPSPSIQIGITDEDRAKFSRTAPMNSPVAPTASGIIPNGGGPSYSQQLISGIMTLNSGESTQTGNTVGLVLDTGAPTTEIHTGGSVTVPQKIDSVLLTGTNSPANLFMQFEKGSAKGLNDAASTSGTNPLSPHQGYMNTGLNVFFANDVLFDLEKSRVRFRPVPNPSDPVTIPLQVVNIGTSLSPEYKLGIYVGLGDGEPKLYEFDTGAPGFFAAYDSSLTPWWNDDSFTPSGRNFKMHYSSGNDYTGQVVKTKISIYASNAKGARPVASVETELGQILHASGNSLKNWDTDLADGKAPLYGSFYGDFGVGLDKNTKADIYAILPQLGPVTGPLADGFIIHAGKYLKPEPTLQIGLTKSDRDQFTTLIAMNPSASGQGGVFPIGGESTFGEQLINATLVLNQGMSTQSSNSLGVVLDTGAPTTAIHAYGTITLPPTDQSLVLASKATPLMQYEVGSLSGLNAINIFTKVNKSDPDNGYLNSGLNIFFQNDVMYDLKNKKLGLLPIELSQTIQFPAISSKTFGDAPFNTSATASSSLPLTYKGIGPVQITGNTLTLTGAGKVQIRAFQAGDSHYHETTSDLISFTVNQASQTINFPAIGNQTTGQSYTLQATATSDLTVSFSLVSGPAKLSGNVLTFTGPGTVTVEANQDGNKDYLAAPSVLESILIK